MQRERSERLHAVQSRLVHQTILLEACIENSSRSPLVMESIRFDPAAGLGAKNISNAKSQEAYSDPALAAYMDYLQASTTQFFCAVGVF